jgi:hypothetical protein
VDLFYFELLVAVVVCMLLSFRRMLAFHLGKQFGTRGVDFIKETTMDKTNKVLLVLQDVI